MKQTILDTIDDMVADFLYYDRKADNELSRDDLEEAVKSGEITIDEMTAKFHEALRNGLKRVLTPTQP